MNCRFIENIFAFTLLFFFSASVYASNADSLIGEAEVRLSLCQRSELHLLGCTFFLNKILSIGKPPLVLVTEAQWLKSPVVPTADFGIFKIIRLEQFSAHSISEEVSDKTKLFFDPRIISFSFLDILNWIRQRGFAEVEHSDHARGIYLAALAEWLHAFDLHASIWANESGKAQGQVVQTTPFQIQNKNYIYIRPAGFSGDNCNTARKEILAQNLSSLVGIILDLRNLPGGLLSQGICWAGIFLPKGTNIFLKAPLTKDLRENIFLPMETVSTEEEPLLSAPLLILQNAKTASIAEVIAASLRENAGAWLLGTNTFGKWTIQDGTLKFGIGETFGETDPSKYGNQYRTFQTTHSFYLPSGISFQLDGVTPDFKVFDAPGDLVERPALREKNYLPLALPKHGKNFSQERVAEIKNLEECAEAKRKQVELIGANPQSSTIDYQLTTAQILLTCFQR